MQNTTIWVIIVLANVAVQFEFYVTNVCTMAECIGPHTVF